MSVNNNTKNGLYFDTNHSGYIDSRQTLCKLVFSLFCVYVKRVDKAKNPPKYPKMKRLIESLVNEMRPLIGSKEMTLDDDDTFSQEKNQQTRLFEKYCALCS